MCLVSFIATGLEKELHKGIYSPSNKELSLLECNFQQMARFL